MTLGIRTSSETSGRWGRWTRNNVLSLRSQLTAAAWYCNARHVTVGCVIFANLTAFWQIMDECRWHADPAAGLTEMAIGLKAMHII